ncbi:unnamed protein product [Closterium sp. Yama58-4]|nr:unnamed protein product [Closterium sp. Yama58-4]
MDTSALTTLSTIMDTSDPIVLASVATAALVLFLFIWRIVFFFTADADLTLLLKGPPPEGAFEDKVVWITGASQGIGQELAQRFAAMGARLILSARSAERLEVVRATCRGKHAPEGVVVLPFDLKGGADVLRGAVRQAESAFRGEGARGEEGPPPLSQFPPLTTVVTAVSFLLNSLQSYVLPLLSPLFCLLRLCIHLNPFLSLVPLPLHLSPFPCTCTHMQKLTCEDTPEDTLRGMLEVNVVATIELTRYLLPCMMQRNKGQVLVVSSAAGKLPAPTQGVYAATKHALHGYFNTLRYEAVQHGVAVTLVCPGPIATEGSAEGAIKSALKPSVDQAVGAAAAAAAGGDEKKARLRGRSNPHRSHVLIKPLVQPLGETKRAHCECCCLAAGRSMDLQTSCAATHVPRTVFPCHLQHAVQTDRPQASSSTQGRQQQHVFCKPPIHPHILPFLLLSFLFLLPTLRLLLFLFLQPLALSHTRTPHTLSATQVPLLLVSHSHIDACTRSRTLAPISPEIVF